MDDEYRDLMALLSAHRRAAGQKQSDVATALGVVPSTVGNWETGLARPPLHHVVRWMALYGLSLGVVTSDGTASAAAGVLAQVDDIGKRQLALDVLRNCAVLDEDALRDVLAIARRFADAERRDESQLHLQK